MKKRAAKIGSAIRAGIAEGNLAQRGMAQVLDLWATARDLIRYAARRAQEERLPQVAGSLTFTTTLSIVPLLAVAFAILSAMPVFAPLTAQLRELITQNLIPGEFANSIFRYLNQFSAKARGLTVFGLVFLVTTAVLTMLTIDRTFNTIWRVRRPRPLSQRVLVYWAVLTVGPILLGLSLYVTSYLMTASAGLIRQPPATVMLVFDLLPVVILALAYAAMYVYVPNRQVAWRDALVGGVAAAVAFELAKRGFASYIAHFPAYTKIYGTLAALPVFLIWIYLSWLITLFGATLAASMPALYGRGWNRGLSPGESYADALRILRALQRARRTSESRVPGLTVKEIRAEARIGWDETEGLLERLEADGLVIRTRPVARRGPTRTDELDLWLFTADPARVKLDRLFRLFVFDGYRVARSGFRRGDPLAAVVAATRIENLDLTLEQVLGD